MILLKTDYGTTIRIKGSNRTAVISALIKHPDGLTIKELMAITGKDRTSIRRIIDSFCGLRRWVCLVDPTRHNQRFALNPKKGQFIEVEI